MAAVFNLLLISSCLLQWRGGNAFTPAIKDAEILSSTECDDPLSDEPLLEILNELPPPGCNLIHLACYCCSGVTGMASLLSSRMLKYCHLLTV